MPFSASAACKGGQGPSGGVAQEEEGGKVCEAGKQAFKEEVAMWR
jgi:hypothetical protein